MKLDDLKTTYQKETDMIDSQFSFAELRDEADRFDRRAKIAWLIELLTAAAVIAFVALGWSLQNNPTVLFQVGMASMIAACVFVAYKILMTKSRQSHADHWTLASRLDRQIEKLEQDALLLRSVASWYLTPIAMAVFLCSWGGFNQRTGQYTPDAWLLGYWGIVVAMYIGIYWLNVYKANHKIQPLLDKLKSTRAELQD